MKIFLLILLILILLWLFGEFLLDLILGALALIIGFAAGSIRTLFSGKSGGEKDSRE